MNVLFIDILFLLIGDSLFVVRKKPVLNANFVTRLQTCTLSCDCYFGQVLRQTSNFFGPNIYKKYEISSNLS